MKCSVVFLAGILTVGGCDDSASTSTSVQPRTLILEAMKASSLYAHYERNEVKADEDCKGRWCLVTGRVRTIGKDILDTPYVSFTSADDGIFSVQCCFSEAGEIRKLGNLIPGQSISIAGLCKGKMGNVLLDNCRLVSATSEVKTAELTIRAQ